MNMNINIDKSDNNPLFEAYEERNYDKFCELIDGGENINCINPCGELLISEVVSNFSGKKNNRRFFDKLIESNVLFLKSDNDFDILTASISFQNDIYYMKKILEKGISVNTFGKVKDSINNIISYGPPIFEVFDKKDVKKIKLLFIILLVNAIINIPSFGFLINLTFSF